LRDEAASSLSCDLRLRLLSIHTIRATRPHPPPPDAAGMDERPAGAYEIRIRGVLTEELGAAYPELHRRLRAGDTLLTLRDESALYGVLRTVDILGLELLEVRRLATEPVT